MSAANSVRAKDSAGLEDSVGTKDGMGMTAGTQAKPTPGDLGIDVAAQRWERSGAGDGSIEIAFPENPARWARGDWVLMRVTGDQADRVLVFDRNEWVCFLDGVRKGEFDDATDAATDDPTAD